MNKDVIYIDVEDDVTAIIGKIKASKEKIIALVPPKRVGILQSAVNLRLLDRMASTSHKRLVLITNNQALIALSATAGIPIAKNLQSKPELPEISALNVDDEDDVIDGNSLSIGELAKTATAKETDKDESLDETIDTLDIDDKSVSTAKLGGEAPKHPNRPKSAIKVPNFSSFRKKLFISIGAFVILVGFLIWANIFAPAATIIVTAKTISSPISIIATLGGATPTDVDKGTIQTISQQLKKDVSVKFTATGSKDVGEKAIGTITIENCDRNTSFSIAANTIFVSGGGLRFVSDSSVVVPGFTGSASDCRQTGTGAGTVTVSATAQQSGESYNIAATDYSIIGVSGDVYAHGTQMSGGTTRVATIVSELDVQKATDALNALPTDDHKAQLVSQFGNGEVIINDSFTVEHSTPVSSPAVGAEATGQATLTSNTTFTIFGLAKSDVELYLKTALDKQLSGATSQRIYDDGIDQVVITGYNKGATSTTINITAKGQVGPNIDPSSVKDQIKGKKSGEVRGLLSSISGVSNVAVDFSYPWVTTIPNDPNKVDVEFKLTND
jgi:hypothetical protein